MYKLVIYIPTFNRPRGLENTLQKLIPQIDKDLRIGLIVADNCSDYDIEGLFLRITSPIASRAHLIRRDCNIGANANILRGFEFPSAEYVWILGDDDEPAPSALSEIILKIEEFGDVFWFNFRSRWTNLQRPCIYNDINQLLKLKGEFGSWMFISANVFKIQECRDTIPAAYQSTGSNCGHVLAGLRKIKQGSAIMHCNESIVTWQPGVEGELWNSNFLIYSELTHALGARWLGAERELLAKCIAVHQPLLLGLHHLSSWMHTGVDKSTVMYWASEYFLRHSKLRYGIIGSCLSLLCYIYLRATGRASFVILSVISRIVFFRAISCVCPPRDINFNKV